jgi:RNA polymerase sigma-70 factor (ECF subfamily)
MDAQLMTCDTDVVTDQPSRSVEPRRGRLDAESADWLSRLSGEGAAQEAALARLHALLLRVTRAELQRRSGTTGVHGPELDDLAHQAAGDAMVAVLGKLASFRGDSRFTTWAYRFAILEVSNKLGRHFGRDTGVRLDAEEWDQLPDRLGVDPASQAEGRELVEAVRRAIEVSLSERQRQVFVAIVVNGVPLDAVVAELGTNRNAVYKSVFDGRRKIRAFLVANGYLEQLRSAPVAVVVTGDGDRNQHPRRDGHEATMSDHDRLEAFLATDPSDVGCGQALRMLHVYVELVATDGTAAARYPGVAAHLDACGPCAEDFAGLLNAATVREPTN